MEDCRMSLRITEPMKEAIRKAWREGMDPFDIQDQFGIGRTSMEKITRGIPSGRRRGQRRKFDYAEAARLRAKGMAIGVIAQLLGVQENSIYRALRQSSQPARMEWKAAA
jgi:hypothetical protein